MKRFRRISTLLVALMIVLGASAPALAADASVTFENGKVIAFAPGSAYTSTDLFDNFKGVMPGDVRTEKIIVQNNSKDFDYIKVYMKAVPHDENGNPVSEKVLAELASDQRNAGDEVAYMYDFLNQMSLKVMNGSAVISETKAGETAGLTENVYLGTLRKGESLTLNAELTVPITMGNEYMARIGEADWMFTVEGYDDPKGGSATQTSDDFNAVPYAVAGVAALAVVIAVLRRRKSVE